MKRKYGREETDLSYLERSAFYYFKTKFFYFEGGHIYPLQDYGNVNCLREVSYENLSEITDLVIEKGSIYLQNQLTATGKFGSVNNFV